MVPSALSSAATGDHRGRWRVAPAMRASVVLHILAFGTCIVDLQLWPWALASVLANQLVLICAGVFRPRGRLLGPNIVRLPDAAVRRGEIALTFDDGPDPAITPRVLDLLDHYQMKASFFCVGEKVRAHPAIVEDIVRRGHSVENHSYRHAATFALWGPWRLARDVAATQAAITQITGQRPSFFRAPIGLRSPLLDPVLAKQGLRYVSWTRRGYDAVRRDPVAVMRDLKRELAAGNVLLLHDGARTRTADGTPIVLAVLPTLLEHIRELNLKSVSLTAAWGTGSS